MSRIVSAVFVVGGAILLAYGISAYHSVSSGVSRVLTGAPTDKSLGLMIGGAAAVVIGLFNAFHAR
jgi:hypothetical protein